VSDWVWVLAGVALFVAGVWSLRWVSRHADRRIDDMVDAALTPDPDDEPAPGCDCQDCADLRAEAARRLGTHRPDCGCGDCWAAFVARMRDIAARQAAEIDKQGRRK
jgi:hypothetical protein